MVVNTGAYGRRDCNVLLANGELFVDKAHSISVSFASSRHRRGLTLKQLADQMLHAGAAFAINMDGGSSSVLVESNLGVISRPTCFDLFPKCEHAVASVLCIGRHQPALLRET